MSPASERVKRHRQRRRAGLTVLPIAVDLGAVAEFLIDRGFLEAWDDRDRDAVAGDGPRRVGEGVTEMVLRTRLRGTINLCR